MAKNRIVSHLMCEETKEKNYTLVVSKGRTLGSFDFVNTALNCASIRCTKKLKTRKKRPVALIGRAADSKSEGWGFKSLLACQAKSEHCLIPITSWNMNERCYSVFE